jgi:hypothetical protein
MTFMIRTPRHQQADGGDARHRQGQGVEDLVEGRQQGVLGDEGDIVLALVAFTQDGEDGLLGEGQGGAAAGLDQDAKEGRAIEEGLGGGDRDQGRIAEIRPQGEARALQEADDPEAAVTDTDPLAEGGLLVEEFPGQLLAQEGDGLALAGIARRQELALSQFDLAHRLEVGGGADDVGLPFPVAVGDRGRPQTEGRDPFHQGRAQQGQGIVQGQVPGRPADQGRRPAGRLVAPRQDNEQVGPKLGELARDIGTRALP